MCIRDSYMKAFDSCNREKLLTKLRDKYGISDHWLRDYLCNRKQFVSLGENSSAIRNTMAGVPAGSILGPRLFSLFLNDMPEVLEFGKCKMFADDSGFYFVGSINDLSTLQNNINSDMSRVCKFVDENSLSLNGDKSDLIIFGSHQNLRKINDNFSCIVDNVDCLLY